jgi:nucleotide-binding universal stress UspA family protein
MKIMACYDDSDESKETLKEAMKHAKAFNSEVMLVTSVVSDDKYYPKMIEPIEQKLKEAQALFAENNVVCKTHISHRQVDMSPGEDLAMLASREQVDEIIVGIRERSKVGKFIVGSVAQWVILKAECPVLGVKKRI